MNLTADFDNHTFHGYVDITIKVLNDTNKLILDVNGLSIQKVTDNDNTDLEWSLSQDYNFGNPLTITLNTTTTVRVHYSTKDAESCQWLEPEQTEGKVYPFCYTQCQAILARSLVPCHDTPSAKATYSITVSCPNPLVARCSGQYIKTEDHGNYSSYSFNQPIPIPVYLIAIVIGKLEKGQIGPRSFVYTEKELLARSIYEFSEDTENFLKAGEEITGLEYQWTTYDLVVLPSAFPYGGMENPNLTFVSSSLLAGDRSLTDVVAHEITHSWSGNLVTNSSWLNFWLNEGFTDYITRLILGKIHGKAFRHFDILSGYNALLQTVEELKDIPEYTKLCPNLEGIHPDDAFSKIPYEKGSLFLFYLEQQVGEENMMNWLHSYFNTFKNQSITTDMMKDHFLTHFSSMNLEIDWQTWLYGEGMPPFDPRPILDQTMIEKCLDLASMWLNNKGSDSKKDDLKDLMSQQTMLFLDELINDYEMDHETLELMDSLYDFSNSTNIEIHVRFLKLCLMNNYVKIIPKVANVLSRIGRGLYVKPLYTLLNKVDHAKAVEIYNNNRPYYHSVIRKMFDTILV